MSTNISKQKREDLLAKIKEIRTFISAAPQDANTGNLLSYLSDIEKDVNGKKYGLIFEEHREEIDEVLDTHTPVLTEQRDLYIANGGEMNFLIEGDNLASLKLLEKTHRGEVDLIYIDPPYNRGKTDFVYDDDFVVTEDMFKHSKWISFMKARLECAKRLLAEKGLIFISIDDNEVAALKLLCDEVFGTDNFINIFVWQRNSSAKTEKRKLIEDVRDAMAAENAQINLPINQITEKPVAFPLEMLFTYDGSAKSQAEMTKNVYKGYLSSAEKRSMPEKLFERHCQASSNVVWFYKNGDKGAEYFSIVYEDNIIFCCHYYDISICGQQEYRKP